MFYHIGSWWHVHLIHRIEQSCLWSILNSAKKDRKRFDRFTRDQKMVKCNDIKSVTPLKDMTIFMSNKFKNVPNTN